MASAMEYQGIIAFVLAKRSLELQVEEREFPRRRGPPMIDRQNLNMDELRAADEAAAAALANLRIMYQDDPAFTAWVALKVREEEKVTQPKSISRMTKSDQILTEIFIAGWIHAVDDALEHQLVAQITRGNHTSNDSFEVKAMRLALEGKNLPSMSKLLRFFEYVSGDENRVVTVIAHHCVRLMSAKEVRRIFSK